jgi:hypothetical protein
MVLAATARSEEIVREWEVDRSWSAHPSSPPILITAGPSQYLAYYNGERRLTLAWRRLDENVWQRRHFPVVTRWAAGGHALIGLTVDRAGFIHLVPHRRDLSEQPAAPPNMIYLFPQRPPARSADHEGHPHGFPGGAESGLSSFPHRQGRHLVL